MQVPARPYVMAAAALAATGLVAVTPTALRLSAHRIVSMPTRLVDADSLLNVPFNLFQDLVNIPGTEVEAFEQFGNADLFGGTIFTASATNIFGEDPGDPGRFMSVVDMLLPFKALSGQGLGELQGLGDTPNALAIDPTAITAGDLGLSQQIALAIDAELPASASSDADWSAPLAPVTDITGFTGIDRTIESLAILSGSQQFPLLNDFFQANLTGTYDFGNVVDPSAGVGVDPALDTGTGINAVPSDSIFGFLGTHPELGDIGYGTTAAGQTLNEAGNPVNLMPWAGQDFTLNLSDPVQNFVSSLEAPIDPSGFDIPSLTEIGTAIQTFAAGLVVALDPFVPGSPFCPDTCGLADSVTQQALVQDIANLMPGNTSVDHWLALTAADAANGPTAEQIAFADEFLSGGTQGTFDIGNPLTSDPPLTGEFAPYTPDAFPTSPAITDLISLLQATGEQSFVDQLAEMSGYVPVFGPALPESAASAATSTADLSPLITDLFNPADWSSLFGSLF